MPIPFLVWGIVAGVVVIVTAGGITFACLKGKKVAFLGMTGAGKTTAVHALQAIQDKKKNWCTGDDESEPTVVNEEHKNLCFKICIDTSGAQQHKKTQLWKKIIKEVDYVFYFFDISQLNEVISYDGNNKARYHQLVEADLSVIEEICSKQDKQFCVLATHADLEYDKKCADSFFAKVDFSEKCLAVEKGALTNYNESCKLFEKVLKKMGKVGKKLEEKLK